MVYGIIELINFAHGDLFMLGSFLALQVGWSGSGSADRPRERRRRSSSPSALMLVVAPLFCAVLNVAVDRAVYKPLRNAPEARRDRLRHRRLFVFMNVGLFWSGAASI